METKMKRLSISAGLLLLASAAAASERLDSLSLERAIRIALQNHRAIQVSQAALDMAEAQYQQAMAGFGPRLDLDAGVQRADQDRTFDFKSNVTLPAPLPPIAMPLDLKVKLFDRDIAKAGFNFSYPLYTGGKKEAVTGMAQKGVAIAREEKRKTELEIVRDVRKYYDGAQFARQMEQLASDTLERFQALEDLTERLYQNASLKVKKTDYLRSKTTTAVTRSMLQEAKYASALTREALANAMGLSDGGAISLAPAAPLPSFDGRIETLVADAMMFNPDKQRLEFAVDAAALKIDDAASAGKPIVGLEASTYRILNDYQAVLISAETRSGWTVGIGVKWNLFDSGLTREAVNAARADKMKLEAQRALLDNGIALQVKDDVLRIRRSRAQVEESAKALGFAEENRKLNVRAYQEEMVETKDVIEAQLIESFASAGLYRAQHDLRTALADLDFRVGKALEQIKP
jgi:outer membrane protein TolC